MAGAAPRGYERGDQKVERPRSLVMGPEQCDASDHDPAPASPHSRARRISDHRPQQVHEIVSLPRSQRVEEGGLDIPDDWL